MLALARIAWRGGRPSGPSSQTLEEAHVGRRPPGTPWRLGLPARIWGLSPPWRRRRQGDVGARRALPAGCRALSCCSRDDGGQGRWGPGRCQQTLTPSTPHLAAAARRSFFPEEACQQLMSVSHYLAPSPPTKPLHPLPNHTPPGADTSKVLIGSSAPRGTCRALPAKGARPGHGAPGVGRGSPVGRGAVWKLLAEAFLAGTGRALLRPVGNLGWHIMWQWHICQVGRALYNQRKHAELTYFPSECRGTDMGCAPNARHQCPMTGGWRVSGIRSAPTQEGPYRDLLYHLVTPQDSGLIHWTPSQR